MSYIIWRNNSSMTFALERVHNKTLFIWCFVSMYAVETFITLTWKHQDRESWFFLDPFYAYFQAWYVHTTSFDLEAKPFFYNQCTFWNLGGSVGASIVTILLHYYPLTTNIVSSLHVSKKVLHHLSSLHYLKFYPLYHLGRKKLPHIHSLPNQIQKGIRHTQQYFKVLS